jgi:hypothetical protein
MQCMARGVQNSSSLLEMAGKADSRTAAAYYKAGNTKAHSHAARLPTLRLYIPSCRTPHCCYQLCCPAVLPQPCLPSSPSATASTCCCMMLSLATNILMAECSPVRCAVTAGGGHQVQQQQHVKKCSFIMHTMVDAAASHRLRQYAHSQACS